MEKFISNTANKVVEDFASKNERNIKIIAYVVLAVVAMYLIGKTLKIMAGTVREYKDFARAIQE